MPQSSGRPDHNQIDEALADAAVEMLASSARYDATADDGTELFGQVMDAEGIYALIGTWREGAWQDAEDLRHARALGGVNGLAYQLKLDQIEASAEASGRFILEAVRTTPEANAARSAHCAANILS